MNLTAEQFDRLCEIATRRCSYACMPIVPVEVVHSQFNHSSLNKKRGMLIPLEEPFAQIESRVMAIACHIGRSKQRDINELLVVVQEGRPFETYGETSSQVIYAENWPITVSRCDDNKFLKVSERGGPMLRSEFERKEAAGLAWLKILEYK